MPGLDGTGPAGPHGFGRGGLGAGRGIGRGMGWGRGGCGRGEMAYPLPAQRDNESLEARLTALEEDAREMRKLLSEKKTRD